MCLGHTQSMKNLIFPKTLGQTFVPQFFLFTVGPYHYLTKSRFLLPECMLSGTRIAKKPKQILSDHMFRAISCENFRTWTYPKRHTNLQIRLQNVEGDYRLNRCEVRSSLWHKPLKCIFYSLTLKIQLSWTENIFPWFALARQRHIIFFKIYMMYIYIYIYIETYQQCTAEWEWTLRNQREKSLLYGYQTRSLRAIVCINKEINKIQNKSFLLLILVFFHRTGKASFIKMFVRQFVPYRFSNHNSWTCRRFRSLGSSTLVSAFH